jgi:hypothetical protein
MRNTIVFSSSLLLFAVAGCGTSDTPADMPEAPLPDMTASHSPPDMGVFRADYDLTMSDLAHVAVPTGFERWCNGKDPTPQTEVSLGALSGTYAGFYNMGMDSLGNTEPVPVGELDNLKVIAPAPMWVEKIRVAFAKGSGRARIHLENTFGRSYPASFPATDPDVPVDMFPHFDPSAVDLIPPIEIDVTNATPEDWIEIPIQPVALEPTQHYMLVYEHLQSEPYLAVETVPDGQTPTSTILYPDQSADYGVGIDNKGTQGNFRIQVVGHTFCEWSANDKWFNDVTPFGSTPLANSEIADINGDRHDDLIVTTPRTGDGPQPHLWFGNGDGTFYASAFDSIALLNDSPMVAFADFDNDGDQDAFATIYVYPDQDGDNWTVQGGLGWSSKSSDCNDHDPMIYPGAMETNNGKDDNCDGVADEGTKGAGDKSDSDHDKVTIAMGDCDDYNPAVYPGAPELLDGVDNDCNGKADETFHDLLLLNTTLGCGDASGNCPNGDGHFVVRASSGLEFSEPASSVAVLDTNGDGLLDLYWGSWLIHYPNAPAAPSHFFEADPACLNDATMCGHFVDKMKADGISIAWRPVYGVSGNDFNNDGLQDIYVSNYQLNDNLMWLNLGDEMFKNVAHANHIDHDNIPTILQGSPGGHSYQTDFGDIDNDGDMDFFLCNLSHPRTQPWADPSQLYINQGSPMFDFVDKRYEYGILYDEGDLAAQWGDYDNDMDLDLMIGGVYPAHYTRIYRNDGDHFTDITYETGAQVHQSGTVGWADFNEDGFLDIKLHGSDAPQFHLFMNKGNTNHWVEIWPQGTKTNRDGIGARITLSAGGVTMMRDVRGVSGGGISSNQSSRVVHFGLGTNQAIDSVTVRWVGGQTETINGLAVDGIFQIVEGSGMAVKIK